MSSFLRNSQRFLATASVVIFFGQWLAPASAVDVAIVAAATNSNTSSERFTDLRDVLVADGRFGTVDIYSTTRFGTGTPLLSELMQYDSIIHWSNDSNDDAVTLGDVFADYVDAGGGMVQAIFANTSTNSARYLQGRWLAGDYNIIPPMGGFTQGPTASGIITETAHMAAPLEPMHPIFENVGDVRLSTGQFQSGGLWGAYRPTTTALEPNARKLALWEDGKTAVAASDIYPNRIDLGLHPVSDRVVDGYYDITSDTGLLIANSLIYTAGNVLPDGDFDDDGDYDCADIDALVGNIAGSTNDLDFDLTGDGVVDSADLDGWLVEAGAAPGSPTNGSPFLPGDANLNGAVDVSDSNIWNANKFTSPAAWCLGDFNADGNVDVIDFNIWNSNKFLTSDASSGVVPEPTGEFLLWLGFMAFLSINRSRKSFV